MKKFCSVILFLVLGFLVFVPQVQAATAFVQACSAGTTATSVSCTFTSNVAGGDVIAVFVPWESNTITLSSITSTCGTGNFTLLDNPTLDQNRFGSYAIGYATIGSSGSCTVTANLSGSAATGITAQEIHGVNPVTPLDNNQYQVVGGYTSSGNISAALTTTESGDYIFVGAGSSDGNGRTLTAGTTSLTYTIPTGASATEYGSQMASEYATQPTAGAVTGSFTISSGGDYGIGAMAFQLSSGSVSTTLTLANSGGGSVVSSPAGISCGSTCSMVVGNGTQVTLTATPSGSNVTSWSNCGSTTSGNVCTVAVNTNTTVSVSFTPPDTQPPTVPTSFSATAISPNQINLSWTASTDNVGVAGYKIYRCQGTSCTPSVQVATSTGTGTTYNDTGLAASTAYTYAVSAYDAAGNNSAQSASASATTQAQSANGYLIDPSRSVNWSGAGVPGGIPNRTTICATLSPGATVAQINSAIASCPAGEVVYLNAGTYNLSSGIDFNDHSNVTLRGAGANQTFLTYTGGINCNGWLSAICVEDGWNSWTGSPNETANWTAGYAQGTTQITLSNTTNLVAGQSMIALDQCDDGFTGTGCSTGSPTDTGNVWNCYTVGACASVGGGAGGAARNNRSQQQFVLVTAINGSTVTISPGLYMPNWRSGQSPGAFWANDTAFGDGIENLSIDATGVTGSPTQGNRHHVRYLLRMLGDGQSYPLCQRARVEVYQSAHVTVANNYMFETQNSTDLSYGVENYLGSDNLIENNIAQQIVSPYLQGGSDEGDAPTITPFMITIQPHRVGLWPVIGFMPPEAPWIFGKGTLGRG